MTTNPTDAEILKELRERLEGIPAPHIENAAIRLAKLYYEKGQTARTIEGKTCYGCDQIEKNWENMKKRYKEGGRKEGIDDVADNILKASYKREEKFKNANRYRISWAEIKEAISAARKASESLGRTAVQPNGVGRREKSILPASADQTGVGASQQPHSKHKPKKPKCNKCGIWHLAIEGCAKPEKCEFSGMNKED